MKYFFYFIFLCLFFSFTNICLVSAQQRTVTGIVKDEAGHLLPGITVRVKGTDIGTLTDDDGRFSVPVSGDRDSLSFSAVGFIAVDLPAGSGRMDVVLKGAAGSLNEVVVIGFGEKKKATLTGAVSSVGGEKLVATPVENISNMLIGRVPGLSGVQVSGEPGRNSTSIHIRGVSTFSGQEPLIVIDGVQQPPGHAFDQLNNLDANEIESISVLKDAAATAVYGIRGANGVIVVTTKRGELGKPVISLAVNYGFTKATNLLQMVNSYEWAAMRNEAINTEIKSFGSTGYTQNIFTEDDLWKFEHDRDYTPGEVDAMSYLTAAQKDSLNASPALYYNSNNLFSQIFGNTGPQKQVNLHVSGGTQRVKYFSSLGYFNQGSILEDTRYYGSSTASSFDRYNFRSNFDIDVTNKLKLSLNISGQFGKTSGPGANNAGPYDMDGRYQAIMNYIYQGSPFESPGIVGGHLVQGFEGEKGSPGNPLAIKSGSSAGGQNALVNLLTSGSETLYNTLLSNSLKLNYDLDGLTQGLSARAAVNYEGDYVRAVKYSPSVPVYTARRNYDDPNKLDFFNGQTGANQINTNPGDGYAWHKIYYEAGLNYNRTFGGHAFSGLLLGTAQQYSMPGDEFHTPSGLMGFVGRVTYDYRERYLADLNMGYNGTEQFIKGKRFGFFPAVSLGWILSNESFFPKNNGVNFIKFRGSYGEVGNDQLVTGGVTRRYLYLPSTFNMDQDGYHFGASNGSAVNPYYSGATEGKIGNPGVTWERARKTDVGLDARFINDKLSLTADVFKEDRNNILTNIETIPGVYGVSVSAVPPANVGRTTNHGYELVLGWQDNIGDFRYHLTGNLSYARNKVIYKAEAPHPYPWMDETGYAIGQYHGLISNGFFNTEEELNNRPFNMFTSNRATLGDIRYVDINGDGLIDDKDMVPVGYSNLPQYAYSLSAEFSYKGFDLNILITGTEKGSFYIQPLTVIPFFLMAGNALQWTYDGRWTPEKAANGEPITFPRAEIGASAKSNNFLTSDFWLLPNDYVRIKNVELGYTFSSAVLKRISIRDLRIYVNASNLFTWGSEMYKKGLDPELMDVNSHFVYPITQAINFGLNVRF